MSSNLASALILSTFNLASKAFLRGASKDLRVEGLETLLAALQEIPPPHSNGQKQVVDLKGKGREVDVPELEELRGRPGVVTICNHTSVVDDPMVSSRS
jgi:monolysocardiolipin acyltransferase